MWPFTTNHAKATSSHLSIYETVRATGKPNYQIAKLPIPSGINVRNWEPLLKNYFDKQIIEYLEFGWPITYIATTPPLPTYKNHSSATKFPTQMLKFLDMERQNNAMLGPFKEPPFYPWFQISPLMSREKKDSIDRRVIIDLSFPNGHSVNDGIEIIESRDKYTLPTVTDFTDLVKTAGPNSYMWKCDLKRAYRQLRIDPLYYPLLGIQFNNISYIDICPSFGCKQSGGAQQRVSNAVVYIMKQLYKITILAYVDDFGCVSPTKESAMDSFIKFQDLSKHLGLELAPEKSVPPTRIIEWLGFEINTITMTLTIPEKKLLQILKECQTWLQLKEASKVQFQSLSGKLSHISQAIPHARTFMSRILENQRRAPAEGTIKISNNCKNDIKWFLQLSAEANGTRLLQKNYPPFHIECDASFSGAGAYSKTVKLAYHFEFPTNIREKFHINQLEALNAVIALKTFTRAVKQPFCISVITDNQASMFVLNSGRTRDPVMAACAREVALISAKNQLKIYFKHAPSESMHLSDALSRFSTLKTHRDTVETLMNSMNLKLTQPASIEYILYDI